MKKTYYLPLTETVPFSAMERIMDATVIGGNKDIEENNGGEALMQ